MTNNEMSARIHELEWALATLIDGQKEHDIQAMTGLNNDQCKRLYEIGVSLSRAR